MISKRHRSTTTQAGWSLANTLIALAATAALVSILVVAVQAYRQSERREALAGQQALEQVTLQRAAQDMLRRIPSRFQPGVRTVPVTELQAAGLLPEGFAIRPEFGATRAVSPIGQPYRIVMAARTIPAPSFEIVVGVDGAPNAAALDAAGLANTPESISRFQSLVARKIRGMDGAVAGEIAAGTTTLDVPRTGFGQNLSPHFESDPPDTATAVALAGFRAMAVPTVQPLNPGQPAGFNTQVNSPICNDQTASNYGGVTPCTYKPDPPVYCADPRASNFGGALPCNIIDPTPTCVVPAPRTRAGTCPSGQTGSVTEQQTASCPDPFGAPVWSGWTTLSSTCQGGPSGGGGTTPASCVAPAAEQRSVACPARAGYNLISGTVTEQRTWSCPAPTGAPVDGGWVQVGSTCTYEPAGSTCAPGTETRDLACPTGQIGLIREQATRTCPTGPSGPPSLGPWTPSENTCRAGCVVPPPQQSTGPCPAGFTGTILYETPYACPAGASAPVLGRRVEVRRNCTQNPIRPPKALAAGCMVDTEAWDIAAFPTCETFGQRTSTDALLFSVGQVLNNGDEQWIFEDTGRFEVTWSGSCSSPAKLNESQCALWNVPNGVYNATATVRDVVTNSVRTFSMTAIKNVSRCTSTNCPVIQ
jgi:hypothetical protein